MARPAFKPDLKYSEITPEREYAESSLKLKPMLVALT